MPGRTSRTLAMARRVPSGADALVALSAEHATPAHCDRDVSDTIPLETVGGDEEGKLAKRKGCDGNGKRQTENSISCWFVAQLELPRGLEPLFSP